MNRLIRTREAAEILGIPYETLRQWASRENKLPFGPVHVGRSVRWQENKIIAFVNGEYGGCDDSKSDIPDKASYK